MAFSFGAPAAPKPAGSTFSFGAPSSSTPSLFGSTPAPTSSAPSLFGATPAPSSSTSLFGQPASAPAPSGGLFGSTPSAAGGSSLFGNNTAPKPATTSLFGGGGTSQPTSTPSLFGGASQPAATPSLFGQSQQSTSLFGQSQSQPPPQQSLFGGQQPQQSQPQQPAVTAAPLFGQSQSAASLSLFGSKPSQQQPTSTSLFSSQSQPQPQTQLTQSVVVRKLGEPPLPNPFETPIESRIESIKSAYDPQHSQCKFQTYFYNEPSVGSSVKQYGRPPNGTDEKAWLKAIKENPDPEHLVPAIAIGFSALQKRIESQSRLTTTHQQLLSEIHTHLDSLSSTHSLTTSLRLLRAQQTHLSLLSRLTSLISKVSQLSPNRNSSLKREEEELRVLLEGLGGEVERVRNRSNELWNGVGGLKLRKQELVEWSVADENGFNQILEILTSQQKGLDHLTKVLNGMKADTDTMNEAFGLPLLIGATTSE